MIRKLAALAAVALVLSGCGAVMKASDAYEDMFVPIENVGRFDHWRQKVTPAELVADGNAWSLLEIGRRYDKGVGGLPHDRACAAYWYDQAFRASYNEPVGTFDTKGRMTGSYTQTRARLPAARVAYRKLLKQGPIPALDGPTIMRCAKFGA